MGVGVFYHLCHYHRVRHPGETAQRPWRPSHISYSLLMGREDQMGKIAIYGWAAAVSRSDAMRWFVDCVCVGAPLGGSCSSPPLAIHSKLGHERRFHIITATAVHLSVSTEFAEINKNIQQNNIT